MLQLNNLQFLDGNCFLAQFYVPALSAFLFVFVELKMGKVNAKLIMQQQLSDFQFGE